MRFSKIIDAKKQRFQAYPFDKFDLSSEILLNLRKPLSAHSETVVSSQATTRQDESAKAFSISVEMKVCRDCNQSLPLEMFSADRRNKDGKQPYCKPCRVKRTRKYCEQNPEKTRSKNSQYREQNCEKLDEYNRQYRKDKSEQIAQRKHEHYLENREAINAWHADYRDRNREMINERQRRYYANNKVAHVKRNAKWRKENPEQFKSHLKKRRALKFGAGEASLTAEQWREILKSFNHRCAYCGERLEKLTQDHVIPLAKGGSHTADNVVPACQSCNSKKGVKIYD